VAFVQFVTHSSSIGIRDCSEVKTLTDQQHSVTGRSAIGQLNGNARCFVFMSDLQFFQFASQGAYVILHLFQFIFLLSTYIPSC